MKMACGTYIGILVLITSRKYITNILRNIIIIRVFSETKLQPTRHFVLHPLIILIQYISSSNNFLQVNSSHGRHVVFDVYFSYLLLIFLPKTRIQFHGIDSIKCIKRLSLKYSHYCIIYVLNNSKIEVWVFDMKKINCNFLSEIYFYILNNRLKILFQPNIKTIPKIK